jgi:hypothetical protein
MKFIQTLNALNESKNMIQNQVILYHTNNVIQFLGCCVFVHRVHTLDLYNIDIRLYPRVRLTQKGQKP